MRFVYYLETQNCKKGRRPKFCIFFIVSYLFLQKEKLRIQTKFARSSISFFRNNSWDLKLAKSKLIYNKTMKIYKGVIRETTADITTKMDLISFIAIKQSIKINLTLLSTSERIKMYDRTLKWIDTKPSGYNNSCKQLGHFLKHITMDLLYPWAIPGKGINLILSTVRSFS